MKIVLPFRFLLGAALISATLACINQVAAGEVKITKNDKGHFTLLRDGQPYFIRGAGGSDHLDVLKAAGGNSISPGASKRWSSAWTASA